MKINDIQDFGNLNSLADSLYGAGVLKGAACMIGAGFSRLAELNTPNEPKPPLWSDFSRVFLNDLYGSEVNHTWDSLKIAEEYFAEFGRSKLNATIEALIPDQKWEPGNYHNRLMSLPWQDVLTTNYDTLLERAEKNPENSFEVIIKATDIAKTKSPRIVKLHGSIGASDKYVITEEDYRKYPQEYPAFVNLAKQVILENDLCLFGFSGDDPNFLSWIGWVRDVLESSSRKIYLVGVLNLSKSQRKVLTAKNVVTIDLLPLVDNLVNKDDQHALALDLFFSYLEQRKPSNPYVWNFDQPNALSDQEILDDENIRIKLAEYSAALSLVLEKYPGWVIAPYSSQEQVRHLLLNFYGGFQKLVVADIENNTDLKVSICLNILKLSSLSLTYIPTEHIKFIKEHWDQKFLSKLSNEEIVEYSAILLRESRLQGLNELHSFWIDRVSRVNTCDVTNLVYFEQALLAWKSFSISNVAEHAKKINSTDPIWLARKGMLLSFVHQNENAALSYGLAFEKIIELRGKDPESVYLKSLKAWVYLYHSRSKHALVGESSPTRYEEWPSKYALWKTDPLLFLSKIERELYKTFSKKNKSKIENSFDPGYYSDSSQTVTVSNLINF